MQNTLCTLKLQKKRAPFTAAPLPVFYYQPMWLEYLMQACIQNEKFLMVTS